MQRRPTVGPGSQWTPFRRCLPGAISKLGKGATLQRGQTWGGEVCGVAGWEWVVVGMVRRGWVVVGMIRGMTLARVGMVVVWVVGGGVVEVAVRVVL